MGTGDRAAKPSKPKSTATAEKRKRLLLGTDRSKTKKRKNISKTNSNNNKSQIKPTESKNNSSGTVSVDKNSKAIIEQATASEQLSFFLQQYQSANSIQLSSLELESIKDNCMVELSQDVSTLGEHMKAAFGPSWKEILYENKPLDGNIDPGNPAVLVISSSALRSLELLREFWPLTRECHAAKLFAKHMKIEDQVALLQKRVNIASGTPSRIKKLIDVEALRLSRLAVLVLDMHTDVKGYSLLTLPQVRDEFWDLYKSYFHQQFVEGHLRICLYGPILASSD